MRCVLGVDAGGSKCDVILADCDGRVLGRGRNDPVPASAVGAELALGRARSAKAASSAIRKALGSAVCSELHVAGLSYSLHGLLPADGMPKDVTYHKGGEFDAALLLAGEPCGVVALAGTGALVAARTRTGQAAHLDGMGPMLGDRGGGFGIGWAAMRAVARSAWHSRHATSLAGALPQFRQRTEGDPYNPVRYMIEDHDRSEIASYTRFVNTEADKGDRVAREILQAAAAELASTAFDVAAKLEIANEDYALIGVGGVIMHSSIYWNHFCSRVSQFAPHWRFVRSGMPPALGYCLLAAKEAPGVEYDLFRTRLLRSAADQGLGKEEVSQ